jgi:hypothetical protein
MIRHMHNTPQREIFLNTGGIDAQISSTAASHVYAVIASWIACYSVNCSNIVAQFSILGDINLGGNPCPVQRGRLKIFEPCMFKLLALPLNSRMRVKLLNTGFNIFTVFAYYLSKRVYLAWYHCRNRRSTLDCSTVHTR